MRNGTTQLIKTLNTFCHNKCDSLYTLEVESMQFGQYEYLCIVIYISKKKKRKSNLANHICRISPASHPGAVRGSCSH